MQPTLPSSGSYGMPQPPVQEPLPRKFGPGQALLFSIFCLLGVSLCTVMPLLGVMVAAFAAEVLFVCGRGVVAFICAVLGALTCVSFGPASALTVAVTGILTVLVARECSRRPRQAVLIGIAVLQIVLPCFIDILMAAYLETTVWDAYAEQYQQQLSTLVETGVLSTAQVESFGNLSDLLASLWPVIYVARGGMLTCISVLLSLFARRRIDPGYTAQVQPFARFDFSPHVIWPLLAGLVCLALYYAPTAWSTQFGVAAATLLVFECMLMLIQGMALVRAIQVAINASKWLCATLWVLAFVLEVFLLVLSLIGLIDVWANFRKLPREGDGSGSGAPQQGAGGQ